MSDDIAITFSPPVPCGGIGADGASRCNRPATAGMLHPMGAGQYLLTPMCRDCVVALQGVYWPDAGGTQGSDEP